MSYSSTLSNTTNSWCSSADWETVVKVWFYTSIATSVSAFAGNVLVIWVVYKAVMLRSTSNYFIVNMAISDMFLPAVNLFIVIFFDRKEPGNLSGPVGTVLCKFLSFFFYLSYGVSMFSLVVVTVGRFYAVVFPMRARVQNRRTRVTLLICSWLISTAMSSPELMFRSFNSQTHSCNRRMSNEQLHTYFSISISLFLFVPLIIMVVLYSVIIVQFRRQKIPGNFNCPQTLIRRRQQNLLLTKMFITIASAFSLTCGSAYVVHLLGIFSIVADWCTLFIANCIAVLLPTVFHAVNPVIYFIFCSSFRQGLEQVFSCCCHHSTQAEHQAPGGDQIQLDNLPAQA